MVKKLFEKHPVGAVLLLMLITLSPVMALRDYSPSNELRYVSIVDEAISEGHVFAFTNQGEDYADKPPFYFWLMMLGKLLFGRHCMYFLSLLSFIPACVIIAVMDKWLRAAYPDTFTPAKRAAMALMMATTGLFLGMSVFLRMDMMMCMWIVLALWTFWKWDNGMGNESSNRLLLPIFTFMALFTKGPVGLLVPPVSISVYLIASGRWKEIGKYLGVVFWGLLAALCAIWFTGVLIDGGQGYLNNLLFHQTVDRAVNSFHHKEPVWYYFGAVWSVMAPWCLATVPVLVLALLKKRGKDAGSPTEYERLFALTGISTFVMLSVFSSKLTIYLAPIFPFAVYLWPATLERRGWSGWQSAAIKFPAILAALIGIVIASASFMLLKIPRLAGSLSLPFLDSVFIIAGGMVLAAGGIQALIFAAKDREAWEKPVLSVAVGMLVAVLLISFKLPQINDYVGYGNLCKLVPESGQVYTLNVHRPENMDVYLGRDINDFGKDTEAFRNAAPSSGTLIVPVKTVGESEKLSEYLKGMDAGYCGPYAVYKLKSAPDL